MKGWPGGRAWINSSTLLGRANLVGRLVRDETTRFGGGSIEDRIAKEAPRSRSDRVEWLLEMLVAVPVPTESRKRLEALAKGDAAALLHALGAMPEFQLG